MATRTELAAEHIFNARDWLKMARGYAEDEKPEGALECLKAAEEGLLYARVALEATLRGEPKEAPDE